MKDKLIRFMQGRNGVDNFSRFLCFIAFIILVIDIFLRFLPLTIIGFAVFTYGYYRILSKNIYKRVAENRWYLDKKERILHFFGNQQNKRLNNDSKYDNLYKVFVCPRCGQKLRVPKGKGRIEITCKRCGDCFIKRS